MLPRAISFVDVETSGLSPRFNRIIEIGIIRVEDNQPVSQYSTLINPDSSVDPFVLSMTGISNQELKNAPSFYQVKNQIKSLLFNSVFVAHNVLFDYMFIKREFERLEEDFMAKYCCSVKLSKALYPKFSHHNLDAIIKRFNLDCLRRHRALDDAQVIWDFYRLSLKQLGKERLIQAFDFVMKKPSLPIGISEKTLDSLPQSFGVYIFYNKNNAPLYIGKSKNIKNRVLSHFSNSKRNNLDLKIAQEIDRIETMETAGELGALLLEATLVKKMQPLYNRQLRYARKLLVLKKEVSKQNYHSFAVTYLDEIDLDHLDQVLAIFKSKRELKVFLQQIAKQYNLCLKLLGLEKGRGGCFNYQLKLCFGACLDSELYLKYNLRFDQAFLKTKIKNWPFKGAIALKEKSQKEEIFIIDKWCVLGKVKDASENLESIQREYLFDTDTYQILHRFLRLKGDFKIIPLYKQRDDGGSPGQSHNQGDEPA